MASLWSILFLTEVWAHSYLKAAFAVVWKWIKGGRKVVRAWRGSLLWGVLYTDDSQGCFWSGGVGGVQRRTGRRGGGWTEDVHTHWPWRLHSPLKVPSHSDTQSSCRICCGSGGTLLSCAVYAASKRAKKRRGSERVQEEEEEEEEWGRDRGRGRERVQTMSFCSGGNAAVNFAAPWRHITSDHEAQSECREVFLLAAPWAMQSETHP